MKKIDGNFRGARGSLPPQLFKYIDMSRISQTTTKFVEYMNKLADTFHQNVNHDDAFASIRNTKLNAPDLFGQCVKLRYIDSGISGSVYEMRIGDQCFAFKINRSSYSDISELETMHFQKKARNLLNKIYIGSTFEYEGKVYSWLLMDYVAASSQDTFDLVRERLYYANLTKGLVYEDVSEDNLRNGKIIDRGNMWQRKIPLGRTEIDLVKKLVYAMRTDDMVAFKILTSHALTSYPKVINYLTMSMMNLLGETPARFKKFRVVIFDKSNIIKQAKHAGR